ncbi:hypothetical protein F511_34817 [Dorcoceras hygrometricum]|uniref:Uncharacterized protein n=1 Tax=Dorcoceras hygrometricum TaxID=472368 RepID=A0A2Z7D0V1_9LAMI|nr:hypothetical protein F511_34817 [Dorcoceras hygrometricum]
MSSWTQSSISLDKLCEIQKPANDRTGLGFNTGESSSGETCTQSNLAHDKFKKMSFVKASVIHDPCESVRYDDQISELLNNKKGKAGIGYDRPESSKSGLLKNRLDKEKAKAGSKSFVQIQQRHGSKKVKSEWKKINPANKGKAPLQERDPVKGNPVNEQLLLIVADIELLVNLREQVIDEGYCCCSASLSFWFSEANGYLLGMVPVMHSFLRYSLFSGLSTVDIRNFVSTLALNRSVLIDVQLVTHSVSVAPSVQTSIASVFAPDVQSITSSDSSADSSANSSLRLNANDISTEDDAALDQSILPSSAADISASLAALRESFSKLVANQTRDSRKSGDAHSKVLCKINHVERVFLDSLAVQNESFRGLFKSIRQEAQNDNNALSLALKAIRTQNTILSTDLVATQKEFKDLKVALSKDFDDKLADIRNELLEFRVETQEQLASLGAHLAELIAFLTKGSDEKRGKAVAAAHNCLLMTKIDQVVEVVVEQMTQADMVEALSVEKVVTEVVMVGEEVTVVVLQREGALTVVVDLVVV